MKKTLLPLLLVCFLFVSCVSSDFKKLSDKDIIPGKIIIQIDQSSNSMSGVGIGYSVGSVTWYTSTSETIKLGTIENKEIVKSSFIEKGYTIVEDVNEADYFVVIESTSNEDLAKVSIGFYEVPTYQLLLICEGRYGVGWGYQDDLNKALLKALDAVPSMN